MKDYNSIEFKQGVIRSAIFIYKNFNEEHIAYELINKFFPDPELIVSTEGMSRNDKYTLRLLCDKTEKELCEL